MRIVLRIALALWCLLPTARTVFAEPDDGVISGQIVTYRSDQLAQLQDQAEWQLDIPVYESTPGDDAIQFERVALVLVAADRGVWHFMEMGGVVNGAGAGQQSRAARAS
jgi:hypothetical protein